MKKKKEKPVKAKPQKNKFEKENKKMNSKKLSNYGKADTWNLAKRMTEPIAFPPKSTQEAIPIYRVSKNGVFEIEKDNDGEHLFDKVYEIEDVNMAVKDAEEKTTLLLDYCRILNSLQFSAKIVIANYNRNMEDIENDVFISKESKSDIEAQLKEAFNQNMKETIVNEMNNINQVKYLVVTGRKRMFSEANMFFSRVESVLKVSFKKLGSELKILDGIERLKALHNIYRMGTETEFIEDWDALTTGTFKGNIAPMKIKQLSKDKIDYLQMDDKFVCTLAVKKGGWPTQISDRFMIDISNLPIHTLITLDIAPIPQEVSLKRMTKNLDNVEMKIQKQQEVRNKNQQYSSDITFEVRQEKEMIEDTIEQLTRNGQKFFHTQLLVTIFANSEEELFTYINTVMQTAAGHLMVFTPYCVQQIQALNTALPLGAREVNLLTRVLFTNALAAFTPFYVQELYHEGGIYYGHNQLSKKLIVGDRKRLLNGNGWVFGVPGSGKSFDVKMEIGQVFCGTDDDIIVIDPQNEYFDIGKRYDGQVVNFTSKSTNYINPFEVIGNISNTEAFIAEKSEFALEIFNKIKDGNVSATENSWIDRAVRAMYKEYFNSDDKENSPTMHDLKRFLESFNKEEPEALALSLDMFTEGSLDIFAHQTNINTDNRFIVYGTNELGASLQPIAMLIMIEAIRARIAYNQKIGKVTRIYVDEAHELTEKEYTAIALERLWKEVRKQGGFMTGITQNVGDVLRNKTTRTMLANSEFVMLLNQAAVDLNELITVIDVTATQLTYVMNAKPGTGILKFGSKVIPFDNNVEKDSMLYEMFNTNFHEIHDSDESEEEI